MSRHETIISLEVNKRGTSTSKYQNITSLQSFQISIAICRQLQLIFQGLWNRHIHHHQWKVHTSWSLSFTPAPPVAGLVYQTSVRLHRLNPNIAVFPSWNHSDFPSPTHKRSKSVPRINPLRNIKHPLSNLDHMYKHGTCEVMFSIWRGRGTRPSIWPSAIFHR